MAPSKEVGHFDDNNQPPPSAQPNQDDFDLDDYVNPGSDNDTQQTNVTSVVEETQFVDIEIDTQALDSQVLDSQAPDNQLSPTVQKALRELPGVLHQPPVLVAEQLKIIARPEVETIEDLAAGFKYGVARPNGSSFGKPQSINQVDKHAVQENSSMPLTFLDKQKNSHPIANKGKLLLEEHTQPSLPSRGGRSRGSSDVGTNNVQVLQNTSAPISCENDSKSTDTMPTLVYSNRNVTKLQHQTAQIQTMPLTHTPMHEQVTSTSNASSKAQTSMLPPKQKVASHSIPTQPIQQKDVPMPKINATKTSRPPFADVAREKARPASVRESSAAVQDRENASRQGVTTGYEVHRVQQENQAFYSDPRQYPQGPSNLQKNQELQIWSDNTSEKGNSDQRTVKNGAVTDAHEFREVERMIRVDGSRRNRNSAPLQVINSMGHNSALPDAQNNAANISHHPQGRRKQAASRPLPAAQLQPRDIPHHMTEDSRGITKTSRSRQPSIMTPQISNSKISQTGSVQAMLKPNSTDILQMAMYMTQVEQEQSKKTVELQIRDQQAKIERLVNENSILQEQIGLLQEEKHRLDTEFVKLKTKSEYYKTHMNDVTRSQKHLEGLILKSNEKQDLLMKDIEERENSAMKEVEEARIEVETFRSTLAEKVSLGVKEARHEIELLQQLREHLRKDLEAKVSELQLERGKVTWLQKKMEEREPNQEPLFQKLQEHFENVTRQLNGFEGKLSSMASGEETSNTKFDECLGILNVLKDKESPQPPVLGELTKAVESLSTRVDNRLTSDGETQVNLRETGNGLLDDLKNRVEAIRTDQKAQEALTDRIATLREANASLTEKVQALEVQLRELRNQHLSIKGEYSATKEELNRVLALPREDPLLQSQIQQLKNTNATLQSQIDTISKEASSVKEQLVLQQNKVESEQQQSNTLRNKLRDTESLVSGFEAQKSRYEQAKTAEAIKLRKELEMTLTEKMNEQSLQHENTELGLRRAKTASEDKLNTALADLKESEASLLAATNEANQLRVDLEKSKASCLAATSETSKVHADLEKTKSSYLAATSEISQFRANQEASEIEKAERVAEIGRLDASLHSITERYGSASNELQSMRDEISQCKQVIAESENHTAKSVEIAEKARDEALQRLKNVEENAGNEIDKLNEQIAKMQERLGKSRKLEDAFGQYLLKKAMLKDGQNLQQWADDELQSGPQNAKELASGQIQAEDPAPRPVQRVSFQNPSPTKQVSFDVPPSSSRNLLQAQQQSARSGRPRIAQRKATSQNSLVNPAHINELDNMLMKRTETTEFSVRTSKTYESHRNTPKRTASSAGLESQTSLFSSGTLETDLNQSSHVSSPMTDLEPIFSDSRALGTDNEMVKALKKQRSIKSFPNNPDDNMTRVQKEVLSPSQEEESARRRQKQPAKSALKRRRSTNTSNNSEAPIEGDVGHSSSQNQSTANDVLSSKSTNITPGSSRLMNQHGFSTSPYNRIVSGKEAPKQAKNAIRAGYKSSSLKRSLSISDNGEAAADSAENGNDHPAKLQRTSQTGRAFSKSYLVETQGDSQFSTYTPSQEL